MHSGKVRVTSLYTSELAHTDSEEIKTLRANLKQARQDHQALEAQVRELRSTETSTRVYLL